MSRAIVPVILRGSNTSFKISGASSSITGGVLNNGRTSATTYIESGIVKYLSAGTLTWENGGLRHEGPDTNLQLYSEQFDNGVWIPVNAGVTPNTTTAPDGALTADSLIPTATNALHGQSQVSDVVSGVTYFEPLFVKANGYSWVQLLGSTKFDGTNLWCNFDITNGVIGNKGSTATDYSITALANGWFRIDLAGTCTSSGSTGKFIFAILNGDTASRAPSFLADGTSGIYIWGNGLKTSRSSYIPTTTTVVPRATDSYSAVLRPNKDYSTRGITFFKIVPGQPNSTGVKSWIKQSPATEGVIDNGSGQLTLVDKSANTATAAIGGWAMNDTILGAAVYADGSMSLHISKNGGAFTDSSDTTFAGFTKGSSWLFFKDNPGVFSIVSIAIPPIDTSLSFADMQTYAKANAATIAV